MSTLSYRIKQLKDLDEEGDYKIQLSDSTGNKTHHLNISYIELLQIKNILTDYRLEG